MIETQLKNLKENTINFAHLVEDMLTRTFSAVINKDEDLLDDIINKLEPQANLMDLEIDKLCITTLAQYSPKASNLRMVIMILKISNDLERMADHCVGICKSSIEYLENNDFHIQISEISDIADQVGTMLKKSIIAFIENDSKLAKKVCKKDIDINLYRDQKIKEYITLIKDKPINAEVYIYLIKICDRLERIADLSTNIAEDVFFLSKGKVIKHKKEKAKIS